MSNNYYEIKDLQLTIKKLVKRICKLETTGSNNGYSYIVDNYNALAAINSPQTNQFAYVKNSQGTAWLPWNMGGTYYPSGTWFYTGTEWINDKSQIALELYNNNIDVTNLENGLVTVTNNLATHVADLANPHQTPTGGGSIYSNFLTEDTADSYYRGYNKNTAWEVEKFPETDTNAVVLATELNNPAYMSLATAWSNRATLTYA